MSRRRARQEGFTLIEILIVVIIIGILAAIATMAFARQREQAKTVACRADMALIEKAEKSRVAQTGSASPSFQTLVGEHLLDRVPLCPEGGTYSWVSDVDGDVRLSCSIHGMVSGGSVTAVASTFTTTTGDLITLLTQFYATHGYWPRSWAPYCYTDLGLDPTQYPKVVDGVRYKVGGSRVSARPEPGYVMTVVDAQGTTRVLTSNLQWDLVYDATTGQWYYHTIDPSNLIDINTLQTRPA